MPLSLKQFRYFIALAEAESFSLAAVRVSISQPALSQQIKEMETDLGAVLFDRLPRGVRLTRQGREVLSRARRILAEVSDLEQSVRWTQGLSGRLKLGVIPTVAPYLLPQALARIRASDVSLDIRIREAQTDDLVDKLKQGRLDAVVAALPLDDANLMAEPLFRDRFVLAGSVAQMAEWKEKGDGFCPADIRPEQLLLLDEGHCLADQALDICGMPARRPVDLGASSLATLTGLVAEGFGLTLLPEISLKAEISDAGSLGLLRFARPEPYRTIALLRRTGSHDDGWVAELAGHLRAAGEVLTKNARELLQPC